MTPLKTCILLSLMHIAYRLIVGTHLEYVAHQMYWTFFITGVYIYLDFFPRWKPMASAPRNTLDPILVHADGNVVLVTYDERFSPDWRWRTYPEGYGVKTPQAWLPFDPPRIKK